MIRVIPNRRAPCETFPPERAKALLLAPAPFELLTRVSSNHPVPKGVSQETVPRGIGSVENHAVVSFRPFPIF